MSDQVGSLVQYKKFHKGKVTKPKITDEGAEYWSDSEDDSFEEDLNTGASNPTFTEEGAFIIF